MIRPRSTAIVAFLFFTLGVASAPLAHGQDKPDANAQAKPGEVPARFIVVQEPITTEKTNSIRERVADYLRDTPPIVNGEGKKSLPILVFEFRPAPEDVERSPRGAAEDLASYLLDEVDRSLVYTVAFVPESLNGYAVLPVLSCNEIALAPTATLGPITPKGHQVQEGAKHLVKTIAAKNGREDQLGLLLAMLDPSLDVRRVRTADKQVHYVAASDLDAFRANHAVAEESPAWEAGNRGILTAEMGDGNLVKVQAVDRGELRRVYGLDSTADLVGGDTEASELVLNGPITRAVADHARRFLKAEASHASDGTERTRRVFLRISSSGGDPTAINNIAQELLARKEIESIAYVQEEAKGLAGLVALACNQIVMKKDSKIGGPLEGGGEDIARAFADSAEAIAKQRGHASALARGLFDKGAEVVRARDNQSGAVVILLRSELQANRHVVQDTIKKADETLSLTADEALSLGLASKVVASDAELWKAFNLKTAPKSAQGTWVDNLVTSLNDPWMSGMLLFVGLFMLILELKLPGVGLPAIISAVAFLLFFWSHYLGGTADGLEVLLFLVGIICIALELFVFPGFAVFGLSGILLVLASVIMASHTFIWPTTEYEYRQMNGTLMEVAIAIVLVSVGAVVLGRYFPSLPLFRRMVLQPVPAGLQIDELTGKPIPDGELTYAYLMGETGRTTTALKPTGKARFGETLVDVTADGFYIEPNAEVEVIDVQGAKVIVKRA